MSTGLAYRVFATAFSFLLFYTSSAAGVHAAVTGIGGAVKGFAQGRAPVYTEAPVPVKVPDAGHKRDPKYRGGAWDDRSLANLKEAKQLWGADDLSNAWVSLSPQQGGGGSTPEEGGEPYPWENHMYVPGPKMSLITVNTNTQNVLTAEQIVGWPSRGMDISLTLYHNSQSNYQGHMGRGWSHTYDVTLTEASNKDGLVRWGDGTPVNYKYLTVSNGIRSFTPPAGFHDTLIKNVGSDFFNLTTKDGTSYRFNAFSGLMYKLASITDRAGNVIQIQRGTGGVTKVTCPTGRYLEFNYDTDGKLASIVAPDGQTWALNAGLNYTTTLDRLSHPSGTKEFTYQSLTLPDQSIVTRITKIHDFAGEEWSYSYPPNFPFASSTTPMGFTTLYAAGSGSYTVTLPGGQTRTDNYSGGKLTSIVDEAGYSVQFQIDSDNNVYQYTDQRGKVWRFTHDAKGNVLTEKDPLLKTWTYTYNGQNDLLTAKDPLNNQYTLTWDTDGNLLTVKDPLNRTVMTNTYGPYGELLTSKNAEDQVTTVEYDAHWNVDLVTDPTQRSLDIVYDVMGRPLEVENANNQITEIVYDSVKRPYKVVHPDSSFSFVTFDANGNVKTARNELGKLWTFDYDLDNRLWKTTNPKSEVEEYTLNNNGWVTGVENGRGFTRTYNYTPRGEVSKLTMPDGSVEDWSYNGTGDVTLYKNGANGTGVVFEYDNAGRNVKIDYPTNVDTVFTYDNADRLTTMVDGTGTTTWSYNAASEVTSIASPQGTVHYTYHPSGRRATMRPGWLVNPYSYSYDAAGRLTTFGTPWSESVVFEYDNLGRENKRTFTGGHYEERTYDSRDRLSEIVLRNSAQSILRIQAYSYYSNNNVYSHTVDAVTTTYGYDDIDQLISETDTTGYSASYQYDANGNRTNRTVNGLSETYVYDSGDKLQSVTWNGGYKNYTYDGAGNTKTIATPSGTTTLNYDEEGRMSSIFYPNSSINAFTYNGFRARRSITDSAGTRNYVRDGQGAASDIVSNGQGFPYAGGLGEHRGTATFWHHGGVKNVDGRTDTSGAMLATKRYDAFGNQKATWGWMPTVERHGGRFGYQSDSDSSLQLLGHRYYDSASGRFVTRDQVKAGANWYSYCDSNPISRADPLGHDWRLAGGIAGGIIGGLVGGPAGAALGAAVGSYLGSYYGDGATVEEAAVNGLVDGVLVYVGGKVLSKIGGKLLGKARSKLAGTRTGILLGRLALRGGIRLSNGLKGMMRTAAGEKVGQGISVGARAIEKHAARAGSAYNPLSGNIASKNAEAARVIDEILSDPGTRVIQKYFSSGKQWVLDAQSPGGRGLRFTPEGRFVTVLEP